MARLPLLLWPHLSLQKVSVALTQEEVQSESFKEKLKELHETLLFFRGVGISAIQCDWPVRLYVMRTAQGIDTYVNPEIVSVDGELELKEEGCLSLPGYFDRVERYPDVIVEVNDIETWERKRFDLTGVEAQCAQHEIEHLDGVMRMMDGAGRVKRDIVKRKIRKQLRINPRFNGAM